MPKQSLNSSNGRDTWQNTIKIKGPILCPPLYNQTQSSLEEGEEAEGVCTSVRVKSLSSKELKISIVADLLGLCGSVRDGYESRTGSGGAFRSIDYSAYADVTASFDVTYNFESDFVKDFCADSTDDVPEEQRAYTVEVSDPVFSNGTIGFYADTIPTTPPNNAGDMTQSFNSSSFQSDTSVKYHDDCFVGNTNMCESYPYTRTGGVELPYPDEYGVNPKTGYYIPAYDHRARAKFVFYTSDDTPLSEGTSITLESTDGTSITYTASSDPTPGSAEFNVSGTLQDMVLSLVSAIESQHGDKFMFEEQIGGPKEIASSRFTIFQTKIGTGEDAVGNTDITISGNTGPCTISVRSPRLGGGSEIGLNPSDAAFLEGKITNWGEDGAWKTEERANSWQSNQGPWLVRLTEEEHRPPTTGRMKGIIFNARPTVQHDTRITVSLRGTLANVDVSSIVGEMENHIKGIDYTEIDNDPRWGPVTGFYGHQNNECDVWEARMPWISMGQGGGGCGRWYPSLPNYPVYKYYSNRAVSPAPIQNEHPYTERGTKPSSVDLEVQCDFEISIGERVDIYDNSIDDGYRNTSLILGHVVAQNTGTYFDNPYMSVSKETERISSNKILFKYDEKDFGPIYDKNYFRSGGSLPWLLGAPVGSLMPTIRVSKPFSYSPTGYMTWAPLLEWGAPTYPDFDGDKFQASFSQSGGIPATEIEVEYKENDLVGTRQEEED